MELLRMHVATGDRYLLLSLEYVATHAASTRPMLQQRQKVLAKAPSTRDPKRTFRQSGQRVAAVARMQPTPLISAQSLGVSSHMHRPKIVVWRPMYDPAG